MLLRLAVVSHVNPRSHATSTNRAPFTKHPATTPLGSRSSHNSSDILLEAGRSVHTPVTFTPVALLANDPLTDATPAGLDVVISRLALLTANGTALDWPQGVYEDML